MPSRTGTAVPQKPGAVEPIGAGLRSVDDLSKLMVVPAVRIVIVDDHRRVRPLRPLLTGS